MDALSEDSALPSWLLQTGPIREDIESSFKEQSLADLLQYYADEGFDENGHLSFNTKKARSRLWTIWQSYCVECKINSHQPWLDLLVGNPDAHKYFQTFLQRYVQESTVLRPCLGPAEWTRVRTINRATTVEALWATLVSVANDEVMRPKKRENPAHAHFYTLDINSQKKGARNPHACAIAKWIGTLAVRIGLSSGQLFTKQEMTADDISRLLDTLWTRAADIPCTPQTRTAFHSLVLLSGIGGWRQGGLVGFPYRCVELAFVRDPHKDPHHPHRFRLAARITINQIKQKKHAIKRDQSDIMSFTVGLVPCQPLCLVSFLLYQAIKDNALEANYTSPNMLIDPDLPSVPQDVNWVNLAWKKEWLDKPIIPITYETFARIWKLTLFVLGLREIPRPYSMRYGAGARLDGSLTPAVRNYILSQSSAIHEKFYQPKQVRENLMKVSLDAGAAANDEIVEMYRNACLTNDPNAPIYLTTEELESLNSRRDISMLKNARRLATRAGDKKRMNQLSARIHHITDALEALVVKEKRTRYFAAVDKLRALGEPTEHLHSRATTNPRRKYHAKFSEPATRIGQCFRSKEKDQQIDCYLMSYLRMETDEPSTSCEDGRVEAKAKRQPRCLICGKSFPSKASLNRHVWASHSFTEAFPCPECHALGRPKALISQGKLSWVYHVSEAHGQLDMPEPSAIKAFTCLLCDQKFTQKGIQEHFKRNYIKKQVFEKTAKCPACCKQGKNVTIHGLESWIEHASTIHNGESDFFGAVHDSASIESEETASALKRKVKDAELEDFIVGKWKKQASFVHTHRAAATFTKSEDKTVST